MREWLASHDVNARGPFGVGAASALVVSAGFAVAGFSDWEGLDYDIGFALVCAGTAGLLLGGFVIQLRAGLRAMRGAVGPLAPVMTATLVFCLGATLLFALGLVAVELAGRTDGGPDWVDLYAGSAFFVPWLYGAISGAVITTVVAAAEWFQRRRGRATA